MARHGVGASFDAGHVDADLALDGDAEVGSASHDVSGARARDQGLGRHAASIHARPSEELALHDGDRHSRGREARREWRPSLPGAENDGVEAPAHASDARMSMTIKSPPIVADVLDERRRFDLCAAFRRDGASLRSHRGCR